MLVMDTESEVQFYEMKEELMFANLTTRVELAIGDEVINTKVAYQMQEKK